MSIVERILLFLRGTLSSTGEGLPLLEVAAAGSPDDLMEFNKGLCARIFDVGLPIVGLTEC